MQARFTWNLVRRDRKPASRAVKAARVTFSILRNGLAILGVCFVVLLVLGMFQYLDQQSQNDIACAVGRCM